LLDIIINIEEINPELLELNDFDDSIKIFDDIYKKGSKGRELKENLLEIFSKNIFEINVTEKIGDLNQAENKWFIPKQIEKSKGKSTKYDKL
jgi:hypothetical protein